MKSKIPRVVLSQCFLRCFCKEARTEVSHICRGNQVIKWNTVADSDSRRAWVLCSGKKAKAWRLVVTISSSSSSQQHSVFLATWNYGYVSLECHQLCIIHGPAKEEAGLEKTSVLLHSMNVCNILTKLPTSLACSPLAPPAHIMTKSLLWLPC